MMLRKGCQASARGDQIKAAARGQIICDKGTRRFADDEDLVADLKVLEARG